MCRHRLHAVGVKGKVTVFCLTQDIGAIGI